MQYEFKRYPTPATFEATKGILNQDIMSSSIYYTFNTNHGEGDIIVTRSFTNEAVSQRTNSQARELGGGRSGNSIYKKE